MPVVLHYRQPYFTLPLDSIDWYYIWCFGIHIVNFGVYLQVLAKQPNWRLNNTVNRMFKPGVLATRMTDVLPYERPHLILPSSNVDSYLIWCCGVYFVDSAVVFVYFCTGSADSPFFVEVNRRNDPCNAITSQEHITILRKKQMTSCGVLQQCKVFFR
jgi:hypothetical protein